MLSFYYSISRKMSDYNNYLTRQVKHQTERAQYGVVQLCFARSKKTYVQGFTNRHNHLSTPRHICGKFSPHIHRSCCCFGWLWMKKLTRRREDGREIAVRVSYYYTIQHILFKFKVLKRLLNTLSISVRQSNPI